MDPKMDWVQSNQPDQTAQERAKRVKEIDDFVDNFAKHYNLNDPILRFLTKGGIESPAAEIWEIWTSRDKEQVRILKNKLQGKTIVDLGFGNNFLHSKSLMKMGIAKYIGVDGLLAKYHGSTPIEIYAKELFSSANIEPEFVEQDMLKYVARMPDASANFMLNAIDHFIIPDKKYWQYLIEEIHRATETGGIVTGANAPSDLFIKSGKFKLLAGSPEATKFIEAYLLEKV